MNEIYTTLTSIFGIYAFGIGLAFLWVALCLGTTIIRILWAWLDDSKVEGPNPVLKWVACNIFKYKFYENNESMYRYHGAARYWYRSNFKGRLSDGHWPFFATYLLLLVSPIFVQFFLFWSVLGAFWLTLYSSRAIRRLQKKLNSHIKNKEAHKDND